MRQNLILIVGIICLTLGVFSLYSEKTSSVLTLNPTNTSVSGSTITVSSTVVWNDTGVQIKSGNSVSIQAAGQVNIASPGDGADKWVGPNGWGTIPSFLCNGRPCLYKYAVNDSLGSLIGKIGKNGRAFSVGSNTSFTASESGNLYLGVNDGISDWTGTILSESELISKMYFNNRGSFTATIQVK
jgi:hypothetical protein